MDEAIQIVVNAADVQWAVNAAQASIEKWSKHEGYYNNRLESHLKGKLGELAVERYLLETKHSLDAHFRFPDRERLSDIVVKIRKYTKVCRLEVKTWSHNYWAKLGRCIAVDQFPDLKRKADLVVWCVIHEINLKELYKKPVSVSISLAGWSTLDEIANATVQNTGIGSMRKIRNYQLEESDLHPIRELLKEMDPDLPLIAP